MEQNCVPNIHRLLRILEFVLSTSHNACLALEAVCNELDSLLNRWHLPPKNGNDNSAECTCLESQQHHLNQMLDKVDKAVKFSQCVREGRDDVKNPWFEEQQETSPSPKRVVSRTGLKPAVPVKPKHVYKRGRGSIESDCKRPGFLTKTSSKTDFPDCEEENQRRPNLDFCPLHCKFKNGYTKEYNSQRTVGLAEAIDVLGIPPELVTVLKTFYRYFNRLRTSNSKNKAENAFVRRLNILNEAQWEQTSSLSDCFFSIPLSPVEGQFYSSIERSLPGGSELSFTSAWNPPALENISVVTLGVQYQDEESWQLLQNHLEQLQICHIEYAICGTLGSYCVELFEEFSHSEASLFLKVATALCRISLLSLPFLVKTQDF